MSIEGTSNSPQLDALTVSTCFNVWPGFQSRFNVLTHTSPLGAMLGWKIFVKKNAAGEHRIQINRGPVTQLYFVKHLEEPLMGIQNQARASPGTLLLRKVSSLRKHARRSLTNVECCVCHTWSSDSSVYVANVIVVHNQLNALSRRFLEVHEVSHDLLDRSRVQVFICRCLHTHRAHQTLVQGVQASSCGWFALVPCARSLP